MKGMFGGVVRALKQYALAVELPSVRICHCMCNNTTFA